MSASGITSHATPRSGRAIGRSEQIAVAVIFLIALVLRLVHLRQIHLNDPFFFRPAVDPKLYHDWAVELAQGGWLSGSEAFFLGIIYKLAGPQIEVAKLVQSWLGALDCVLVWWLARQLFDLRIALAAACITSLYGMLIFYEGTLQITNLQTLLTLLLLIAVLRGAATPTRGRWLLAGFLIGLSALARPTTLLFAPFAASWPLWMRGVELTPTRRGSLAAACVLGIVCAIAPVTLRNALVSGDPVLINTGAGAPFYFGNNAEANGAYTVPSHFVRSTVDSPLERRRIFRNLAEGEQGRSLSESEVSRHWMDKGFAFIRENPGAWLALEARKLALFFNGAEIWNNRSFTISREFSWVLRLPLFGFGLIAPLALAGMALCVRRWRELAPLYALVAVYLASALTFFVLSRYRMPVVPIFIVFASAGAFGLIDLLRSRDLRAQGAAFVGLVVLAVSVNWKLFDENLSVAHFNLANRHWNSRDYDLAIEHYRRSLAIDPTYLSSYNNLALVYEEKGLHIEEAIATWEQMLALTSAKNARAASGVALRHLRDLETWRQPVAIEFTGPSRGPEDAVVTIVEFVDFSCPYCASLHSVMVGLREQYPRELRVIFSHLPLAELHPRARATADASECAREQEHFWEYHDLLFARFASYSDAELATHAETLGLDLRQFESCLREGRGSVRVEEDLELARSLGLDATPVMLINGSLVSGYKSYQLLQTLIERAKRSAASESPGEADSGPSGRRRSRHS